MSINQKMYELGNKGSAIRELFEYGKKQKEIVGEANVFDFSLGNPSIEAPEIVNDTLIDLLKNKDSVSLHGYTSAVGDNNVRKAISDYINKEYGANTRFDRVYMTCGAAASLTISLNAICNEGDEVIAFAPFFPEYRVFVEKANATLKVVEAAKDFMINFDSLDEIISEKTKALIINSPNNPSGAILKESVIIRLSDYLLKKEKEYNHPIYLISDEPYREIIFDDLKYPFVSNYYNDSIICYSFSKSLSLPGERIGYIIVSTDCSDGLNVFKAVCGAGRSLGYVCAPALFQYMIPSCLGKTSNIDIYKKNRDLLYKNLKEMGYELVYPDGAFYLFMKSLTEDANEFSEIAKKYNLLLVPSDSFGIKGYVRLAYCVSTEMIENSFESFKKLKKYFE